MFYEETNFYFNCRRSCCLFSCTVETLPEKLLNMPVLTENFYLSSKGITFVYNEYEIASKGAGAIKVLVPYTAFSVKIK